MIFTALRRTVVMSIAAALLLFAAGCGDDDGSDAPDSAASDSASESLSPTATPEGPDCATVWVEGQTLDRAYRGCVQDGVLVTAEKVGCSSGQTFVLFNDEFWAVKGGLIKQASGGLASNPDYRDDMAACRG